MTYDPLSISIIIGLFVLWISECRHARCLKRDRDDLYEDYVYVCDELFDVTRELIEYRTEPRAIY